MERILYCLLSLSSENTWLHVYSEQNVDFNHIKLHSYINPACVVQFSRNDYINLA